MDIRQDMHRFTHQALIIIPLLFASFSLRIQAAERLNPVVAKHGDSPNHLEPLSFYPFEQGYQRLLRTKLRPTNGDYGTYIFKPSFKGEMAVAVNGDDVPEWGSKEPRSYTITVTQADGNLYYASMGNAVRVKRPTPKITRTDVKIDRELAVATQRAWATMLLRTRYPKAGHAKEDGYSAQFSVFVLNLGDLEGQTSNPDGGLPREFVDLGFALAEYTKLSVAQRPAARVKLIARLQAFERKAKAAR